MRPSDALPAGTVMGHEFSGTITELGGDGGQLEVGQRVAVFRSRRVASAPTVCAAICMSANRRR